MSFQLGKRSRQLLSECHPDFFKIVEMALKVSEVDFGISEGYRSPERQKQLFVEGKSKIDGVRQKGMHNMKPSLAIDIFAYHPDPATRQKIAFDYNTLSYLAGVLQTCAKILYYQGDIQHTLRWGGNWDRDGIIIKDQTFQDLVHFELRK
jgi:peptidoglycan L-alanyl-D-glutamate endopeptidase CwlK